MSSNLTLTARNLKGGPKSALLFILETRIVELSESVVGEFLFDEVADDGPVAEIDSGKRLTPAVTDWNFLGNLNRFGKVRKLDLLRELHVGRLRYPA